MQLVEPFLCRGSPEKLARKQVNLVAVCHGLVYVGFESIQPVSCIFG